MAGNGTNKTDEFCILERENEMKTHEDVTAHMHLDERGMEAATDRLLNIRRQDIENGSLMRFREVAAEIIRAYLQTAAADVSGLVDADVSGLVDAEASGLVDAEASILLPIDDLHSDQGQCEWAEVANARDEIARRLRSTIQTISASNAALEAEIERLRVALGQTEYLMTMDSFSAPERLSGGLARVRQAREALSAPKGGQDE